ncbi:uncharacterized protein V6R79_017194 [Siganus canaliculatus]
MEPWRDVFFNRVCCDVTDMQWHDTPCCVHKHAEDMKTESVTGRERTQITTSIPPQLLVWEKSGLWCDMETRAHVRRKHFSISDQVQPALKSTSMFFLTDTVC